MVSVVCAWRENERQTARASYGRDEDEKRAGASIDSRETRRDVESRIVGNAERPDRSSSPRDDDRRDARERGDPSGSRERAGRGRT
jgi:hypothetical protein